MQNDQKIKIFFYLPPKKKVFFFFLILTYLENFKMMQDMKIHREFISSINTLNGVHHKLGLMRV